MKHRILINVKCYVMGDHWIFAYVIEATDFNEALAKMAVQHQEKMRSQFPGSPIRTYEIKMEPMPSFEPYQAPQFDLDAECKKALERVNASINLNYELALAGMDDMSFNYGIDKARNELLNRWIS